MVKAIAKSIAFACILTMAGQTQASVFNIVATAADDTTEGGYVVTNDGEYNTDGSARTVGTGFSGQFVDTVYTFRLPDLNGESFQSAEFNFTVWLEQGVAPTADLIALRISDSNTVDGTDHQAPGTLAVDSILTAAGNSGGDFVTTGNANSTLNAWLGNNYTAGHYAVLALQAKWNPGGSRNRWLLYDDAGNSPPAILTINTVPAPSLPADFDGDGDVDDADFGLAFASFTGPNEGPPTLAAADLDGDNDVDDADYGLMFAAFTGPGVAANVPEPGAAVMLSLLAVSSTVRLRPNRGLSNRAVLAFAPRV